METYQIEIRDDAVVAWLEQNAVKNRRSVADEIAVSIEAAVREHLQYEAQSRSSYAGFSFEDN